MFVSMLQDTTSGLASGAGDAVQGAVHGVTTLLPMVDWLAIAVALTGLALGTLAGLARAFGMLLWMLAALWLATQLAGPVVNWLPNSAEPDDPHALLTAYGVLAALVLALPILARVLGGADGKKKAAGEPQHKLFGALLGLLIACLFMTLLLPYVRDVAFIASNYGQARAPGVAAGIAENATYLYPQAHREALGVTGSIPPVHPR